MTVEEYKQLLAMTKEERFIKYMPLFLNGKITLKQYTYVMEATKWIEETQ